MGSLAARIQIADALAHGQVLLGPLRVAFRSTVDPKRAVIVDGAFRTENGAGLVVDLDRIGRGFMLDADAFRAIPVTAEDIRIVVAIQTFTQEAKHVSAAKGGDRAANELRIDTSQGRRVPEHEIGRPFGLMARPVVVQRKVGKHRLMGGIQESRDAIEVTAPVGLVQLIHQ